MAADSPDSASIARLLIALHASTPPVLITVFLNTIVLNKTFKPIRSVGRALPSALQNMLRKAYVVFNGVVVACVSIVFVWKCPPSSAAKSIEDTLAAAQQSCLPTLALLAIFNLVLLWVDRVVVAFIDHPDAFERGFVSRMATGGTCVGYLMSIAEQDASSKWFLLLVLCNRPSGVFKTLKSSIRHIEQILRFFVVVVMIRALYGNFSSRKLAGLCIGCALHAR